MTLWLNIILQGVLIGGLYAMFAAGLSLIFGVMRLVNIAHGDLIVLAAYVALMVTQTLHIDPLTSLLMVVPAMALIGYALQRLLLNHTLGDDLLPPLLVTFGLSIIIQNGLLELFTADSVKLQAGAIEVETYQVMPGVWLGLLPLIQFAVAVGVIAGLQALFYRTALGRAFRATSDDPAVAQLMGLDTRHVFAMAMALSLAVVAIAGVFLAVRANFDPSIGPARLIFGFEAVVIGGLGSLWGTLAGGVVLGVALAASGRAHRLPRHPRRASAGIFPQGVALSTVRHATRSSRIGVAVIALALVVLAAAPAWGDRQTLRLLAEVFTFVALASLWNLLAGYAGLVSVGQQAFVGLGGYLLFALAIVFDVPPVAAILIAGPIGALVAIPVAALIFRLRGAYFAIGTWVVAEVFRLLASQISVLGGGSGISLPAALVIAMAPTRQAREFEIYWLALTLTVLVLGTIVALLRSRHGLALTAIRDNEMAARASGIDVTRIKFTVYILTAFGTSMIGALIFLQKLRISPDTAFSVNDWTAFVIFITVIGGIGRIEGPIIGTIIFFIMRQTLADLGSLYLLIMGAVAIVVMLWAPKGIWGLIAERYGWQALPLQRHLASAREGNEDKS
jgi:branched-chain amino acid transport system permease protein